MLRPMTKWMLASVVIVAGAATMVWATGCSNTMPMGCCGMSGMGGMNHGSGGSAAPTAASPSDPAAKPVNTTCPIMGGKVNPSLTRQFKGQTVGFCCGMCPGQWDKLNDQDKQAKLDKVLSK